MFPFDRFGAIHLIRTIIELLIITSLYLFGSCRFGIIFGFNDFSSILFSMFILFMLSTDMYYILLSIFSSESPRRAAAFHLIFYSIMSLFALICCVFSIVAFIFCVQKRHNRLCSNQSCFILWISIGLTFILTILYSTSAKLLCCLRGQNSN
jgi:hypothetical protein